ncbi:MAG: NapC/NirT family cytochrome c [Nitrospira sp.]|nr:NapC/NirT family cytochrome c [Nitrospira sp.]MCP9465055.1 NapC/NirT family cytochrome c [Nitrospira sp.]
MSWKPSLLIMGFVAGALSLSAAVSVTDRPTFCTSCHLIAPSYESWAVSTHKEVTCVTCHVRPGIEGWMHDKAWVGIRDTIRYLTGTYPDAHNLKAHVESGICLGCHSHIARVSEVAPRDLPPPVKEVGLIMSHRKHMEAFKIRGQGEGCTTCHAGVVHDRPIKGYPIVIPRGHVSADDRPWYPDHPEGSYLRERALSDCFRCHDGKTVYQGRVLDRKCETCHLAEKIAAFL